MTSPSKMNTKRYCPILALTRNSSDPIEFFEGERFSALASASETELYDTAYAKIVPVLNAAIEGPDKRSARALGVENWNWHYIEISK